jgi:hypothetical protein
MVCNCPFLSFALTVHILLYKSNLEQRIFCSLEQNFVRIQRFVNDLFVLGKYVFNVMRHSHSRVVS